MDHGSWALWALPRCLADEPQAFAVAYASCPETDGCYLATALTTRETVVPLVYVDKPIRKTAPPRPAVVLPNKVPETYTRRHVLAVLVERFAISEATAKRWLMAPKMHGPRAMGPTNMSKVYIKADFDAWLTWLILGNARVWRAHRGPSA
jgi:hypothetical protein